MSKDYYKILGLGKSASPDEIKKAYRRLAQEHHPDKGGNQEKFKEINEAYQVLSDPQKRSQYDQFGADFEQARGGGFRDFSSFSGAGQGFNFEDIFEGLFSGAARSAGQSGRRSRRRGSDIGVDVEISLDEAFRGSEKKINLWRHIICRVCGGTGAAPDDKIKECKTCGGQGRIEQRSGRGFFTFSQVAVCPDCEGEGKKVEKKCPDCGGEGRKKDNAELIVKIPAGIQDDQVISLSGQGEAGRRGAAPGDLYITVHLRSDPRFRRENDDLFYELPISFSQAALGDKIDVPTLAGWIKLKVPEGIESETVIRLNGKGMPRLARRGFGDMMVKVKVKTPMRLSKKVRELFDELKKENG